MCGMVADRRVGSRAGVALALATAVALAVARALRPRDGIIPAAPVDVAEHFSAAEVARARAFRRPQRLLGLASGAVELGLLGALAARPPALLRRAHPAAAGAALSLAATVAPLPVRAVARQRAIAVGLVTQTWRGWAGDLAKASAIGAAFAAGGAALADRLRVRLPRTWWLPGAGAAVGAAGAVAFAGPVVLDPLFNDFQPLEDDELR